MELNIAEMSMMDISNESPTDVPPTPFGCNQKVDCPVNYIMEESCCTNDETVDANQMNKHDVVTLRRSLRKRVRPSDVVPTTSQIFSKVPKLNDDSIEKYYLNNKVKRLPSTLETIFEEPKQQNSTEQYVGNRKFKRIINFTERVVANKLKHKKWQLQIKKLTNCKRYTNRKKISMRTFLNKLESTYSDQDE